MPASWNKCGLMSEKPAGDMTLKEARTEVMKLRLRVITLNREIERGRSLSATEALDNLEAGLDLPPGSLRNMRALPVFPD